MRAWISSSLSLPALVYDMTISQRPSASTLLRMARKISPSDQRLNCPAGVRLEDTNDPIGIEKRSPMSSPPVRGPVFELHAPQKLSAIARPRSICSGVPETFRFGIGAWRACDLNSPTIVSTLSTETAAANAAVRPTPPHLTKL